MDLNLTTLKVYNW